ncbi:MAG: hypothetical protein LBC88_01825 [Spirochaetaceae bacterium]|jgi:hypothetical protein|nr:hypothetical protein [Spirochaetaceae bacterium]
MKTMRFTVHTVPPAVKALVVVLALSVTGPAFSQTPPVLQNLLDDVDSFTDRIADSLPLNASIGLNWASAYIGQLTSVPPHFGVGIAVGVSTIKAEALSGIIDKFGGGALPFKAVFPNPGYTAEARIGGFILPFDIGIKAGYLPPVPLSDVEFNYFLVGGDVRYALIKDRIAPAVSVGVGVNYLKGGIKVGLPEQTFSGTATVSGTDQSFTLKLQDPTLGFEWETLMCEVKAQVSKSFILFTPYAGLGINYSKTTAGLKAETTPVISVTSGTAPTNDQIGAAYGITLDSQGFSRIRTLEGFGARVFGGVAFTIAVIRLDFTAFAATGTNFNFGGMNYGGSIGVRFQL